MSTSSWFRRLSIWLWVTVAPGFATAQQPTPPPAPATTELPALVLQNLAPHARREGCAVVVPFARGTVRELPELHVKDAPTVWEPFGARWPDGSLRQALCLFVAELPALGERLLPLVSGKGPTLPDGTVPPIAMAIEFVVRQADEEIRAAPTTVAVLEQNALRTVDLRRTRIGKTGLVGELIVTSWRDQAHAQVDVAVFFSDPTMPAMECRMQQLALESQGASLWLRHSGRLGIDQQPTQNGSRVVLLRDSSLGDGQGLRRNGVWLPQPAEATGIQTSTLQAAALLPVLGATDWRPSGAFGAYGVVPALPPWLAGNGLRAHLASRHRNFVNGERPGGDPFAVFPFGLAKNPGQTGDQFDFGVVKLSLVAASGLPSLLYEVEPSILQEACRPVHFRAADGSMLRPQDHPKWVVWSGRTHWHAGVSPDRLGKPHPEPRFERHGWGGKDRQHWSSNYLGAYALLTGAHWARAELANEVNLYLAGQTTDPSLTTSGTDSPRGGGRTELAASWAWLCTGDEALKQRMHERFARVYLPGWAGRDLAADRVRPMMVANPDARMLQGKHRYWNPWQDAIAAVGFGAAARVIDDPNARLLAEELALNVVRHGFLLDDKTCIIATAMRWQDGEPLSPAQLQASDPTVVLWSHGTAFTEWSIGAVEIARVAALARGDQALAERATAIQQRVRATRQPPKDGFVDRLSEWDAVAW